jgi:glycine/D-amino acid oxidase-like deaminating enzyme
MGSSTALFLARAGCNVTLIDRAPRAMDAASRWNEGKIHLGFLYAGDPSGRTAAELVIGGLTFKRLTEELIGRSLAQATTPDADIYLVHPNSVADVAAMAAYFQRVETLIADHAQAGDYLAPIGAVEPLAAGDLEALTSGAVRAGFRVPERSVNTIWVADRFVEAIEAEPNISVRTSTLVAGVDQTEAPRSGPWRIRAEPGLDEPFDVVVYALWEGRLAVDRSLRLAPEAEWSHRFRLSLFVQTATCLKLPCLVLATGPFGDVKNYDGTSFYLAWYPAGLVAQGSDIEPPHVTLPPAEVTIEATRRGLIAYLPPIQAVFDAAESVKVGGGWVFALGKGSLIDPDASLHRRDRFGISRLGTYFSVDTGKYSVAPWLANKIASEILGR